MKRLHDWPQRLYRLLRDRRQVPFSWGANDCCLFVADCIAAMTGEDPARGWRGAYDSLPSAVETLKREFAGSTANLAEEMAKRLNFAEVPLLQARRGDVVLCERGVDPACEFPALGVVALDGACAWFLGRQGLASAPLRDCQRAWRVG
jgi:hypothetical protein